MTIRLGILGAGIMGHQVAEHAAATGRFAVASVADADHARAETLAAAFGATAYGGIAELYAGEPIDAVYVGLPHHLHLEACLGAVRADVHALIDKPLCNTMAEADQITAAADTATKVWMMGLSYRFRAEWRRLAEIVHSGLIGAPHFLTDVVVEAHAATPAWYWDVARGGGVIQLQAHHLFDRHHWLLGALPTRVSATVVDLPSSAPRSVQIVADYPLGVLAGMSLSFGTTYDAITPRALFVLQADNGMVQLDETRTLRIVTADGTTEERYDGDDYLRRELDEFAQAIDGSLVCYPGLNEGIGALRAAVAATRAAESGGWVTIDG